MDPGQNPTTTIEEPDSAVSTPCTSPGRSTGAVTGGGYFFSAPASPIHFSLSSFPSAAPKYDPGEEGEASTSNSTDEFEFDFSARSMVSADEIFHNGQIRPTKLSSHLEVDEEDESPSPPAVAARGRDLLKSRNISLHRRTRSMSPVRNPTPLEWRDGEEEEVEDESGGKRKEVAADADGKQTSNADSSTPPVSASSSRSSSSSNSSWRNSRRWVFFKDLLPLHRSKSEGSGGGSGKEKFWHAISFSPSKDTKHVSNLHLPFFSRERSNKPPHPTETKKTEKPTHGMRRRRQREPSAHERHYTANRAQAEEMRRKTFLPYRQGLLLGCLGITSKSYASMNGLARTLNSVASR